MITKEDLGIALSITSLILGLVAIAWSIIAERRANDLNKQTSEVLGEIKRTAEAVKSDTRTLEQNVRDLVIDNTRRLWDWIRRRDNALLGVSPKLGEQEKPEEIVEFMYDLLKRYIDKFPMELEETDVSILQINGFITFDQYKELAEFLQDRKHQVSQSPQT